MARAFALGPLGSAFGGPVALRRSRTRDLVIAGHPLFWLSYGPVENGPRQRDCTARGAGLRPAGFTSFLAEDGAPRGTCTPDGG